MPKRRFQMWIEPLQFTRLLALSRSTGVAIAELIRRAIDQYLSNIKYGEKK